MTVKREYNASFDHEASLKMRLIERRIDNGMHSSLQEVCDDLNILGNIADTYKSDFGIRSPGDLVFNKYGHITNNPFLRRIDELKDKLWTIIEKKYE